MGPQHGIKLHVKHGVTTSLQNSHQLISKQELASLPSVIDCMQSIKEADRPPPPPSVDNSRLHQIDNLAEGTDYTLKSPCTWEYIKEQYSGSGPDIARLVKGDGRVEMPRFSFKIVRQSDLRNDGKSDDARSIQVSDEVSPYTLCAVELCSTVSASVHFEVAKTSGLSLILKLIIWTVFAAYAFAKA